jgi:hypothetical protein
LPVHKERANWRRLKKIFEFSAVPSRSTEFKNYSHRNSFEPFAPAHLGQLENTAVFSRACHAFADGSIPQHFDIRI